MKEASLAGRQIYREKEGKVGNGGIKNGLSAELTGVLVQRERSRKVFRAEGESVCLSESESVCLRESLTSLRKFFSDKIESELMNFPFLEFRIIKFLNSLNSTFTF